ncbi:MULTISPECIES: hypothetical protein [Streptomyces]|uniref:Uncharacterized protein n=1 Tax=Streptomyces flavovirens TaxID=52258 RepID=A0ABV8NEC5_9ACTN|nr:hypothetical protein [Streptomyces sp. MBT51]MBK3597043.1 hypothetical protein [Streptomyces sp. MBT51]
MTDTLLPILLAHKLRFVAMVLDTVDPDGPMTESTRINLAGEATGHHQSTVAALLQVMPAVPHATTRTEYAQALRDTATQTEGGAL